jgi:hypothetical protein
MTPIQDHRRAIALPLAVVRRFSAMTRRSIWSLSVIPLGVAAGCVILISSCGGMRICGVVDAWRASTKRVSAPSWARATIACALLLLSGCGAMSDAETSGSSASTVAQELIRHVVLPAGTQPISSSRAVPVSLLRRPSGATPPAPGEADQHRFWLSKDRPSQLLAFIREHAPSGSKQLEFGSAATNGQDDYWWMGLQVPRTPGYIARLQIAIAPAAGRYAVRVDAVVAALSKRPPDTLVPPVATRLTLVVVGRGRTRPFQSVPIDNREVTSEIASAVNALPVAKSGGPAASCPAGTGSVHVLLTFHTEKSTRSVATVEVDPYECRRPSVWISAPSRAPFGLEHASALLANVQRIAGVHLSNIPH